MDHINEQISTETQHRLLGHLHFRGRAETEAASAGALYPTSNPANCRPNWNEDAAAWRAGEFYKLLSYEASHESESLAVPYRCKGASVLLTEGEQPATVLFLLEGSVKLSLNSIDGRRLILGTAKPGSILGLAAVLSGYPYDLDAETQFPCKLTSLPRRRFLDFIARYPGAGQYVELSQDYQQACDLLRRLGIRVTVAMRRARLLIH